MDQNKIIELNQKLNGLRLQFENELESLNNLGQVEKEKYLKELYNKYDAEVELITREAMKVSMNNN